MQDGGKREGPIETCPKFWNLNPLTASGEEILRIPAWKKNFELVKRELEAILEKEILPATIPEFPTVRRMTMGMNSSLVVPSLLARAAAERQQREFTNAWDPLFVGYTAAVYFHTCDIKNKLMDDSSEEDERLKAPKIRGARDLENACSGGFGEYVTGVGRWQDDCRRRTHCAERRNEVCHKKIPGALRTGTGGDETGRGGAGCSRPVVCGPDGMRSNDTITPISGHPWRQRKRPCRRSVQEDI